MTLLLERNNINLPNSVRKRDNHDRCIQLERGHALMATVSKPRALVIDSGASNPTFLIFCTYPPWPPICWVYIKWHTMECPRELLSSQMSLRSLTLHLGNLFHHAYKTTILRPMSFLNLWQMQSPTLFWLMGMWKVGYGMEYLVIWASNTCKKFIKFPWLKASETWKLLVEFENVALLANTLSTSLIRERKFVQKLFWGWFILMSKDPFLQNTIFFHGMYSPSLMISLYTLGFSSLRNNMMFWKDSLSSKHLLRIPLGGR